MADIPLDFFDFSPLESITERQVCSSCQKSIKYICHSCCLPCNLLASHLKTVSLSPHFSQLKVIILKHCKELSSKSTSAHGPILAPSFISIQQWDPLEHIDKKTPKPEPGDFVLYPSPSAIPISSLPPSAIKRLFVLDATWNQSKGMIAALSSFPIVTFSLPEIPSTEPSSRQLFWRYTNAGKHCVSTIEAIYYALNQLCNPPSKTKEADLDLRGLLYLFMYNYKIVQESYKNQPERKYHTRQRPDYIKY